MVVLEPMANGLGLTQFLEKELQGIMVSYLTFDENGKITEGGDFGDATGLVMSVMPSEE